MCASKVFHEAGFYTQFGRNVFYFNLVAPGRFFLQTQVAPSTTSVLNRLFRNYIHNCALELCFQIKHIMQFLRTNILQRIICVKEWNDSKEKRGDICSEILDWN